MCACGGGLWLFCRRYKDKIRPVRSYDVVLVQFYGLGSTKYSFIKPLNARFTNKLKTLYAAIFKT
jgi:hypothetical protein